MSQDFEFNLTNITIYWANYTGGLCNDYVEYTLITSQNDIPVNSTFIGQLNMAVLMRDNLRNEDGLFSFHVEARNGDTTCAFTKTEIQISPTSKYNNIRNQ